jgi:AraC-like DNA-binding protein
MIREEQKLGSWQSLSLTQQIGPSANGAHRHSSHMLSLQLSGPMQTEWSDSVSSASMMIAPGALTLLPAGSRHAKCTARAFNYVEEPAQLVALISPAIVQASFGARVELKESRGFRDVQLERMLLVLHDTALNHTPASQLFGDFIANAIAVHLMTTYVAREFALPVYRGGIPRSRLSRVLERMDAHVQEPVPVAERSLYDCGIYQRDELRWFFNRAEVAASVGFARQNHFARIFKRHTGLLPNEFRRRL